MSDPHDERVALLVTEERCGVDVRRPDGLPYNDGMTFLIYAGAALAEIDGCFSLWAWLRLGRSVWWLGPGMASLAVVAWLLRLVDSDAAGRTYAAYGGIYIVSSLLWLWLVEGQRPDRWDPSGALVRLAGTAINLFGKRPV